MIGAAHDKSHSVCDRKKQKREIFPGSSVARMHIFVYNKACEYYLKVHFYKGELKENNHEQETNSLNDT